MWISMQTTNHGVHTAHTCRVHYALFSNRDTNEARATHARTHASVTLAISAARGNTSFELICRERERAMGDTRGKVSIRDLCYPAFPQSSVEYSKKIFMHTCVKV